MQAGLAFSISRFLRVALVAAFALGGCGEDPKNLIGPDEKCVLDSDCSGTAATPYCAPTGTCVQCLQSSQCTSSEAPVCDMTSNTCRSCSEDSECASGVCLAASGTCAAPAQIIYVNSTAADNPNCSSAQPCRTMLHAKNFVNATRNVIRVIGPLNEGVELQSKVHVDGDGSTWTGPNTVLSVATGAASVTVEGFTMQGPGGAGAAPVISCLNSGALRVHKTTVRGAGGLEQGIYSFCDTTITDSTIIARRGGAVFCGDRKLTMTRSVVRDDAVLPAPPLTSIKTMACAVELTRNDITSSPDDQPIVEIASAPSLLIENNSIVDRSSPSSGGLAITNAPSGGSVRFNTVVNTATGVRLREGIACAGTTVVTSNVIAWQYGAAQGVNACARRYNAFDSMTAIGAGEGNVGAALSALFIAPLTNLRLAAGSAAHALAEPGLKTAVDLDGKARPVDGRLDAGAYETQ